MTEFIERVADYVELRREVAAGVGGPIYCSDPEELTRLAAQRAAAIRDARPLATEGDIFTPPVAAFFRARITHAIGIAAFDGATTADPYDEIALEVHGTLPWGVGAPASARLVGLLPPLPQELEYRFVGRHLVLLDVEANLVVDVLREAVPAVIVTPANRTGSCEVHPQLPACWM
jgi:hypothetical protein